MDSQHGHTYVFLRQEETNIGYDRNPEWKVEDVYFCSGCLDYARREVRHERPSQESFSRGVWKQNTY